MNALAAELDSVTKRYGAVTALDRLDFTLAARGGSRPLHRADRCARLARRDDREYRVYLREEQRREAGCSGRRMQADFHHGLLAAGQVTALLGPNGASKTTAVRLMLGLSAPTSGTACLFGADPRGHTARQRAGARVIDPELAAGAWTDEDPFWNPTSRKIVTVTVHTRQDVGAGLANRILKDAGIKTSKGPS